MSKERRPKLDVAAITEKCNRLKDEYSQAVLDVCGAPPPGADENTKRVHAQYVQDLEDLLIEIEIRRGGKNP